MEKGDSMKRKQDRSKRKRGAPAPLTGKTRITIYFDKDILEEFRTRADEAGSGYQTMINGALREYLGKAARPIDEGTLRQVIREELEKYG